MKSFKVTVGRDKETDSMTIKAHDADEAKKAAIELFYFDGWHAISAEEL